MGTPVSNCGGIDRNCVWVAARALSAAGRHTNPSDLCIALTKSGSPCGALAEVWFGQQPLCSHHAAQIRRSLAEDIVPSVKPQPKKPKRRTAAIPEPKSQFVYMARAGDRIKIGTSTRPINRLRNIETQSGIEFDDIWLMQGDRNYEARLHRRFKEHRTLGEWFTANPEVLLYAGIHGEAVDRSRLAKVKP